MTDEDKKDQRDEESKKVETAAEEDKKRKSQKKDAAEQSDSVLLVEELIAEGGEYQNDDVADSKIEKGENINEAEVHKEYEEIHDYFEDEAYEEIAEKFKETEVRPKQELIDKIFKDATDRVLENISVDYPGGRREFNGYHIKSMISVFGENGDCKFTPSTVVSDTFVKGLAQLGLGREISELIDKGGLHQPEFTPEEKDKIQAWEDKINGVELICEWDHDYQGYVMFIPHARDKELSTRDNLFYVSHRPETAEQVFGVTKEIAGRLGSDKENEVYEEAYSRMIAEVYPSEEKNWDPVLREKQRKRDGLAMTRFENESVAAGESIDDKLKMARELVEKGELSQKEQARAESWISYLENLQRLEIDREEDLRGVLNPGERRKINGMYDSQIEQEWEALKVGNNVASATQKDWESRMIAQGLLQLVPKPKGKYSSYRWEVDLKPTPSREDELREAATKEAINKRNEKVYGITDDQRDLSGQEWKDFVERKRAEILIAIKEKVDNKVGALKKDRGKQIRFGNLFPGMFSGENELVAERGEKGDLTPNREFLRDFMSDTGYCLELLFARQGDNFGPNYEGQKVAGHLIDIVRSKFPDEWQGIVGNMLDSVYLAKQKVIDDNREVGEKQSLMYINSGASMYKVDGYWTSATEHFRSVHYALKRYTVPMSLDRLNSVRGGEDVSDKEAEENIKQFLHDVNPIPFLEVYGWDESDNVADEYLDLYEKHYGKSGLRKRLIECALFPSLADFDEDEREDKRQRLLDSGGDVKVVSSTLSVMKQRGLLDHDQFQRLLTKKEEELESLRKDDQLAGEDDKWNILHKRVQDTEDDLETYREVGINRVFKEEMRGMMKDNMLLSSIAEKAGLSPLELLRAIEKNPDLLSAISNQEQE